MRRFVLPLLLVASACATAYAPRPYEPIPETPAAEVAAVLFLVGDAGDARFESAPLVQKLRADVERWSGALAADSSVTVVFLGDNIYPSGLHDRSHQAYPADSARLHAQVRVVDGAAARARSARALFVPGNHDWGNAGGPRGRARLANQERALASFARTGPSVAMVPAGGESGPTVVDLTDEVRLLALDTSWWLSNESADERAGVLARVRSALDDAGDRTVIVVAHHPYVTAGPHNGRLATGFDIVSPLRRAGAVVEDINSGRYRELRRGLQEVFARAGEPLLFAAGHDHSLQLHAGSSTGDPTWTLVSGAGSKRTGVAEMEGLLWASLRPGYIRLVFRHDGAVDLFAEAVVPSYLRCDGDAQALRACVADGVAAFSTVYSKTLR